MFFLLSTIFQDLFLLYRFENIPRDGNFFSSAQFAIGKESFLGVGGFSENLQTYEDVDLAFKLQKKDLKTHVALGSRGCHLKNFGLKSIFMDYLIKSRNMIYYRLRKINDLHLCDTFVPSKIRVSYYLLFGYLVLFTAYAFSNSPKTEL